MPLSTDSVFGLVRMHLFITLVWIFTITKVESQDCSTTELNVYGGYQYRIFTNGRTFSETQTHCQSLGGDMAIITSADQNSFIATLLNIIGSYFIGLEDMDQDNIYKWIDGTSPGYANWDNPLNANSMYVYKPYCAVITYYESSSGDIRGKWNRVACATRRRHICQIPLEISRYDVVRVNPYQPSIITCYAEGIPLPDASSVDLRRRIDTNTSSSSSGNSTVHRLVYCRTYNTTGITKRSSSVVGSELAVLFDIENVYPPEDGDYGCGLIIENQFYSTSITKATYVLPVISTAPSTISTTSTTVSLRWNAWSAGEDIGDPPLIGYDVFVRKDGYWVRDQRIDDSITSATVSNLTPDTDYRFRVAAVREGEGGTGPWSPRIDAITLCTAPRSPPAGIQVTANNPKELEVTWEFISSESANCRSGVTHYMIYYALSGSSSTNSRIVPNDTSSYTITGLGTYMDYTIQISASNKDEETDKSSEIIGRTLEEVAPAPINVAIPRSTKISFTVSWSTPLPSNVNGRIQMYTIRYKQSDQGDDGDYIMENALTDAFEAEHTVTNLLYGINYTVQVQTVNGAGSSKWSYPVRAKTILTGHHCNGAQVGTIIAGVSVPLIIIIIFLIILNVVTYRRARLRHPVTASSKNTAREPSPRYENHAFDASMRTCKNVDKDTYQDLDIDTRDYQNPTDHRTYQGLKKTSIDTSHQSVSQPEPEITYEYI